MAEWQGNFGSFALGEEETVLAIRLAEALRTDEVETFLEIYDSIPSTTESKRIDEIKEMARQVAALPKKTFELYRSKKILSSGDHSFFAPVSNQVLANKLNTNSINRTPIINSVQKDLSCHPQNQVDVVGLVDVTDSETKPKTGNKKKRKSKKGKSTNASQEHSVANGISEEQDVKSMDFKHKVLGFENCTPLHVSMNTNLVADISTGRELEMVQNSKSNGMDSASCGSSSSNDSGIVTPDSGLGSYTSPVFTKEPPFGFPPSSQRLLESALGLLPSVTLENDSSSINADTSKNAKNSFQQSEDSSSDQKEVEQNIHNLKTSKTNKTDVLNHEIVEKNSKTQYDIEDDPISDISDTKEVCKDFVVIEGDSVDGDVSSSSAVEEEGGWQSQTRRSHRKKKKELAARASREKIHTDRFQRKDFHKQQSDNQFRKNHYRRKSVDDKKNNIKTSEKKFQNYENKSTVLVESVMNSIVDGQFKTKTDKENETKVGKGPLPSDNKLIRQKETSSIPKVLSYRDVLLKAGGKVEPTESSDSGVDANSVSSCETSSVQQDTPRDSFNEQQCVNYLNKAWKKVMSNAKQGLVIYFSVDSDPVLSEQKRKKRAAGNASSKQQ